MKEIEEKAKEYAKNLRADFKIECEIAYKDGYEQGQKDNCEKHKQCQFLKFFEKENAELKEQIEKMKRPQNCKHSGSDYCMTNGYCVCDKWELAE